MASKADTQVEFIFQVCSASRWARLAHPESGAHSDALGSLNGAGQVLRVGAEGADERAGLCAAALPVVRYLGVITARRVRLPLAAGVRFRERAEPGGCWSF